MDRDGLVLRQADDDTIEYVERLLAANDLPTRDIRAKSDCFYVAHLGNERVGVVGLERLGSDCLLRSLVVERSARGDGVGAGICDRLEARARGGDIETLYLLTTTVPEFFANRGYVELEREDAPPAVRATSEFEDLCPATAVCMRKHLSESSDS